MQKLGELWSQNSVKLQLSGLMDCTLEFCVETNVLHCWCRERGGWVVVPRISSFATEIQSADVTVRSYSHTDAVCHCFSARNK